MAFIDPIPPIPLVPFNENLGTALSFGPITPPILMLPVRLETRFSQRADRGADLRILIYPDKIHIDTHEEGLTEEEIKWGKHFWEQTWRAATNEEARRIAWRQLVERFDAGRAAWIARMLEPRNPANAPTQPVPESDALPKPIKFPSPATKAAAWTRAPHTAVLPKRWWALGYRNQQLVVIAGSNPIDNVALATGPNPAALDRQIPDSELAVDDGMKWMVDYEVAEAAGMGIRMRLNEEQARGFDFLLVFGARAATNLMDATPDLVTLLNAHHYADGLGFIRQGMPSNNTVDAPSGFSSIDPGDMQSYLIEREQVEMLKESNADVLARALGLQDIKPPTFAHIANANETEQLDARHMNRALWPATWDYFLDQMLDGSPLAPDDIGWLRKHFIEHVRAAGPLPALRVGKQPYGILPVTSLDAWKPASTDQTELKRDTVLRDFLLKLRDGWRVNVKHAPRIGKTESPEQDFKDILSLDGISSTYAIRHLMGENYLTTLWSALVPTFGMQKYWWSKQQQFTLRTLLGLGQPWNPRISRATYSGWYTTLKGPMVQPEILSETADLEPNYILNVLLKETDLEKLRLETFDGAQPVGLLYSVLRHAMLREYWMAASKLTPDPLGIGLGPTAGLGFIRPEEEMIDDNTLTPWKILGNPLTRVAESSAWSFLSKLNAAPADPVVKTHVATLLEFRESLVHLSKLKAAKLQRLFAGTLDLCSHRLDAWVTSIATKQLAALRKRNPRGILFGGYGWVINLKPGPKPAVVPPPPEGEGLFFRAENNPGYTHAPSLAQAATVAVLRSGHQTHANTSEKNLLTIDLTSERVRLAEWLLDGVRQGQPLGALLGYRFERRLQDARPPLGQFIPAFREVAPLVAKKLEDSGQPVEMVAANNVVDGLVLQSKWKTTLNVSTLLSQIPDPPNLTSQQSDALEALLRDLDDSVDAVSDALLAESVHHAIHGNPSRVASTLNAVASGEAPPPELDVVRTPRTGEALTYRLVVLFGGPVNLPAAWETESTARAGAEPYLNAWVASLLGDPTRVRCLIERFDPDTKEILEVSEFKLKELSLAPLDYVYAAEGSRDGQPSEIENRILYAVSRGRFPPDAVLRINPGRGVGWSTSDLSYGEFSELVRRAQRLVTGTRGIDAGELATPDQNQPAAVDTAELKGRADDAGTGLRQALEALQPLVEDSDSSLETLRRAILHCAEFGIAGAVPFSARGVSDEDRQVLTLQGNSIAKEMEERQNNLKKLNAASVQQGNEDSHHIDRLRTVFGNSFVVLPKFSAPNAGELEKALADSSKILDDDLLALDTWFQRVSRVREAVDRLDFSLRYAEILETGAKLNLNVAQLPHREGDRWVGLPLKAGEDLSPSRFSLVVQAVPGLNVKQPMTGLLIDEWIEVVPNRSETTAMVFQYDQPDASPPQSILLAVPPDLDKPWNLWSMQQVLLETLDLARIRAVDPESLDEIGHYLPALYFAANGSGDAISTDFSKLK